VILSPAFVADCLETVEELGIRGVELWEANGGELLEVVPCLNADERWVRALWQIVSATDHSGEATSSASWQVPA
jgi:ferrochelatase